MVQFYPGRASRHPRRRPRRYRRHVTVSLIGMYRVGQVEEGRDTERLGEWWSFVLSYFGRMVCPIDFHQRSSEPLFFVLLGFVKVIFRSGDLRKLFDFQVHCLNSTRKDSRSRTWFKTRETFFFNFYIRTLPVSTLLNSLLFIFWSLVRDVEGTTRCLESKSSLEDSS